MLVVTALGGNALLRRGEADDRREPARQRPHRREALAPIAKSTNS